MSRPKTRTGHLVALGLALGLTLPPPLLPGPEPPPERGAPADPPRFLAVTQPTYVIVPRRPGSPVAAKGLSVDARAVEEPLYVIAERAPGAPIAAKGLPVEAVRILDPLRVDVPTLPHLGAWP